MCGVCGVGLTATESTGDVPCAVGLSIRQRRSVWMGLGLCLQSCAVVITSCIAFVFGRDEIPSTVFPRYPLVPKLDSK